MNSSIEKKRLQIEHEINSLSEGHPHYWCGGTEADCEGCNMDHASSEVYLEMLEEEHALFSDAHEH